MKKYIFFAVLFIMFSCHKENNNHIKKIELVNIIQIALPKTSTTMSSIKIQAFAQAGNGCYSNFYFKLTKVNDFRYSLKAYATFETNGACPTVMVGKDTTINFIPEKKGVYIFNINDKPFKSGVDSVIVN